MNVGFVVSDNCLSSVDVSCLGKWSFVLTDTCATIICCDPYLCNRYLFASYECLLSIKAVFC